MSADSDLFSRSSGNFLIHDIQKKFVTPLEKRLVSAIGTNITYLKCENRKRFIYSFLSHPHIFLELTSIKGSLFTYIWAKEARYDDEYLLEIVGIYNDSSSPRLLWVIEGIHPDEQVVQSGDVDWTAWRILQQELSLQFVGVLAFARIVSKFLISFPIKEETGVYREPMPSTRMLEYVCDVLCCPCEEVVSSVFPWTPSYEKYRERFLEADGSGAWITDLFPEKIRAKDPLCASKWAANTLRAIELRPCPFSSDNCAIVLGVFSAHFPHERYVCTTPHTLLQYLQAVDSRIDDKLVNSSKRVCSDSDSDIILLQEQEWSYMVQKYLAACSKDISSINAIVKLCAIEFRDCPEWGCEDYLWHATTRPAAATSSSMLRADHSSPQDAVWREDIWTSGSGLGIASHGVTTLDAKLRVLDHVVMSPAVQSVQAVQGFDFKNLSIASSSSFGSVPPADERGAAPVPAITTLGSSVYVAFDSWITPHFNCSPHYSCVRGGKNVHFCRGTVVESSSEEVVIYISCIKQSCICSIERAQREWILLDKQEVEAEIQKRLEI